GLAISLSSFSSKSFADEAGFQNETEAGLVLTTGNSKSQSFNFKQSNRYSWTANMLKFDGRYLKASAGGVESARFWALGLRYERTFTERFLGFVGQDVESDVFAGYAQKYNSDIGPKYRLLMKPTFDWFVEG